MQIGIRLHDAAGSTMEERLNNARAQGFACTHLAISKVTHHNIFDTGALTPGYAMHIKRLHAQNGLDVAVLGCYLDLVQKDEAALARTQSAYIAHLRFAQHLGCGVVGTETGRPENDWRNTPTDETDEALERFINNLRPVVRCAEWLGVLMTIEPVYCHTVNTPARAKIVLEEISSPALRIILDSVNLLGPHNYMNADAVVKDALDTLGSDIAVLHIKDFTLENGEPKPCAIGRGVMTYDRLLRYAKKNKPYIHATFENSTPDDAQQSRLWMQKLYDDIALEDNA